MSEVFDVSSLALPALPANWHYRTVKEIGASGEQPVLTGPFGTNLGRSDFIETGVPLLTIGCLTQSGINLDKALFVSEAKAEELSRYRLKAGDLLFSRMASVGRAGLVPKWLEGALFNYHIMRLRLDESRIDTRLFINYVRSAPQVRDYLKAVNHGATRDGINTEQLLGLPIAVPPIGEQREIVAELEKQFSRLDEAVANLQRVKANLKRYKASVLKDAVEGRLVPTEAIATDGESNAVWVPISKAIKTLDQGWSPQCESESRSSSDEWAVIKTTAIQSMEFRAEENKLLPHGLVSRAHLSLLGGDLLITRAGPRTRVGVTCLVKSDLPRLMICDKAYRLRAKLDIAVPTYLEVVLNSPTLLDRLDELKSGISDSGLNLTQKRFGELLVPLPSLAEQQRIVDEVDRRLSLVRGVEAQIDANLKRSQALRQSTLSKAFAAPTKKLGQHK